MGEDDRVDVDSQPHLVEIVAALKEITARITSAPTLAEAIHDLLKVTADVLPEHVRCGMTMVREGEPATFTSTGLATEVLDEAQHASGDGPCMEAIRTRDIVMCQDIGGDDRWPAWSRMARRHGLRSVLCYPFDVDALTLGALNVYADRTNAFTDEVPIIAMLVADHASLLLRVRPQFTQDERLSLTGDEDPGDGAAVERAIGIVMAQRGCPPQQALRHLHDAAANLGVGVPTVAERLVRTVSDRGGDGS
jgi:GAF domain-containing protein